MLRCGGDTTPPSILTVLGRRGEVKVENSEDNQGSLSLLLRPEENWS